MARLTRAQDAAKASSQAIGNQRFERSHQNNAWHYLCSPPSRQHQTPPPPPQVPQPTAPPPHRPTAPPPHRPTAHRSPLTAHRSPLTAPPPHRSPPHLFNHAAQFFESSHRDGGSIQTMKTSSIALLPLVVLGFACSAMAQAPAETILPAIIPASPTHVKAEHASATPSAAAPAPAMAQAPVETILPAIIPTSSTRVKAENLTPTRPAASPPYATDFSELSSPRRAETVTYYLPGGAVSPRSGIRTYPGITAAQITYGSTRAGSGIPPGSTAARLVGSNGSRASRPSTKARTVSSR